MPLDDFTARTEQATPRRLQKAREKGSVPRSVELAGAVSFLAVLMMSNYMGRAWVVSLSRLVGDGLALAARPDVALQPLPVLMAVAGRAAAITMPIILVLAAVSALVLVSQSGFVFSLKPITEGGAARLNPFKGFGAVFSAKKAITAGWALVRLAFAALVAAAVAWPWLERTLMTPARSGSEILTAAGELFGRTMLRLAFVLAFLALADTLIQRYQYHRSLKMTKEEVKDERREMEGDPQTRSRQRARRLELARRRMMAEVPKADVVVTNPTHVAVALRYEPLKMAAPRVVAKGRALVAERIREIARAHGVPVVEDAPLARSLLRSVPVGAGIPPQLYRAVAEILAYVYRMKRRRRAGAGS
jgi:flagellar biosynthesis protein FlhB